MVLLSTILHWLAVPVAHATTTLDQAFGSNMGLGQMWSQMKAWFPHSGSAGNLVSDLAGNIYTIFQETLGWVAAALLAYAGLRLSFGGVNEEGVSAWKSVLKNVLIGLIAAMVAEALLGFLVTLYEQAFS